MANVGWQWAIVLEPIEVVESHPCYLRAGWGCAVASFVAAQRVRNQKLSSMREALLEAHEQTFVLRDAGGVVERDWSQGTDSIQILLLSRSALWNHRLRAVEAIVIDARDECVQKAAPREVRG